MMKISIIGAGYVGLVTGACLSEKGYQVVCIDIDQSKVDQINHAIPPIYEEDLPDLLARNIGKNLSATTNLTQAILDTDVTFIAVGTPFNGEEIDLSYIEEAARQIGRALRSKPDYHLVVVKSTVVPGTTDRVVGTILEEASGRSVGADFGLGMNPEFLTEGVAVRDFMFPDRIVLGGSDQKSLEVLAELYRVFEGVPIIKTNNKTAEMIKYTSNALLATMISFSNEIGNLCSALGDIDVVDVQQAIHINNYLSAPLPNGGRFVAPITSFLEAGCGFGGSCLPKDVNALIAHGRNNDQSMLLLDAVMQINQQQHQQVLLLLKRHFPSLVGVRVAILGLAFKPDTDDMRESPAIPIIKALLAEDAYVKVYDPVAIPVARKLFGEEIALCSDLIQAITGVDAIVLVTRWDEFKKVPELLKDLNPTAVLVDGRRVLDKHSVANYEGIGL